MCALQKQNKRVLLIHTGGTIAMRPPKTTILGPDSNTGRGASAPLEMDEDFAKDLFKSLPELKQLAKVQVLPLFHKDSTLVDPSDWLLVAETIGKHYDDFDGFVVTHGTDTMTYAATALSYLLPYPCKPVVFTGALRPLGAVRTDARRNLICSVAFAAEQRTLETCIFFDTQLFRANRTIKSHIEEFHGFSSPNFPCLAEERLKTKYASVPKHVVSRPRLKAGFEGSIQVITVYPGMTQFVRDPKAKAYYLQAFGCGNAPLTLKPPSPLYALLKHCKKEKIPVLLGSQVTAGAVTPELYEMGQRALELGAIPLRDMTFSAALIKAMILAFNDTAYKNWAQYMVSNWAGEITPD